jgi:hypothetical protein
MQTKNPPPQPIHIPGTAKGEEMVLHKGKEPGKGVAPACRTARDSTGIDAKRREPIDPKMPHLPPA